MYKVNMRELSLQRASTNFSHPWDKKGKGRGKGRTQLVPPSRHPSSMMAHVAAFVSGAGFMARKGASRGS